MLRARDFWQLLATDRLIRTEPTSFHLWDLAMDLGRALTKFFAGDREWRLFLHIIINPYLSIRFADKRKDYGSALVASFSY